MILKRRTGNYRLTRYRRANTLGITIGYNADPLDRTQEKLGIQVMIPWFEILAYHGYDLVRLRKHDALTSLLSNF